MCNILVIFESASQVQLYGNPILNQSTPIYIMTNFTVGLDVSL